MRARDNQKKEVIFAIDKLITKIKRREMVGAFAYPKSKSNLIMMRKKYVYKDISILEMKLDISEIKKLRDIL